MCRNREIIHHHDEAVVLPQTNCRLCATYINRDQETHDPNTAPEIHLIVVSEQHHIALLSLSGDSSKWQCTVSIRHQNNTSNLATPPLTLSVESPGPKGFCTRSDENPSCPRQEIVGAGAGLRHFSAADWSSQNCLIKFSAAPPQHPGAANLWKLPENVENEKLRARWNDDSDYSSEARHSDPPQTKLHGNM